VRTKTRAKKPILKSPRNFMMMSRLMRGLGE
jgi:hypothetical protein